MSIEERTYREAATVCLLSKKPIGGAEIIEGLSEESRRFISGKSFEVEAGISSDCRAAFLLQITARGYVKCSSDNSLFILGPVDRARINTHLEPLLPD
jgi:hypothetical protein